MRAQSGGSAALTGSAGHLRGTNGGAPAHPMEMIGQREMALLIGPIPLARIWDKMN